MKNILSKLTANRNRLLVDNTKLLNDRFWVLDGHDITGHSKCVVLSIEEAERVLECVNACWQNTYSSLANDDRELAIMLSNRIKQAS